MGVGGGVVASSCSINRHDMISLLKSDGRFTLEPRWKKKKKKLSLVALRVSTATVGAALVHVRRSRRTAGGGTEALLLRPVATNTDCTLIFTM